MLIPQAMLLVIGLILVVACLLLFSRSAKTKSVKVCKYLLSVAGMAFLVVVMVRFDPLTSEPPGATVTTDSTTWSSPKQASQYAAFNGAEQPKILKVAMEQQAAEQLGADAELAGSYELVEYRKDGEVFPYTGSLEMLSAGPDSYDWMVQLESRDQYGMPASWIYIGQLFFKEGQWRLTMLESNDPSWQSSVHKALRLKKQKDMLKIRYRHQDSDIELSWGRI